MKFEISNSRLLELYEKGTSKKYKFLDNAAIKKFMQAIEIIKAAETVMDFWRLQSLNFEHLEGKRYSMRLSRQIRLELEIEWEDEAKQKGFVMVKDISKHYE